MHLRLISGTETIVLPVLQNSRVIAKATDVFSYISSDFNDDGIAISRKGETGRTPVQVYEMVKNGMLEQLFWSLGTELDKLCLSQSQIIEFTVSQRQWFRRHASYVTMFLFKAGLNFYVACVKMASNGLLGVTMIELCDQNVYSADHLPRIVVPQ